MKASIFFVTSYICVTLDPLRQACGEGDQRKRMTFFKENAAKQGSQKCYARVKGIDYRRNKY